LKRITRSNRNRRDKERVVGKGKPNQGTGIKLRKKTRKQRKAGGGAFGGG